MFHLHCSYSEVILIPVRQMRPAWLHICPVCPSLMQVIVEVEVEGFPEPNTSGLTISASNEDNYLQEINYR